MMRNKLKIAISKTGISNNEDVGALFTRRTPGRGLTSSPPGVVPQPSHWADHLPPLPRPSPSTSRYTAGYLWRDYAWRGEPEGKQASASFIRHLQTPYTATATAPYINCTMSAAQLVLWVLLRSQHGWSSGTLAILSTLLCDFSLSIDVCFILFELGAFKIHLVS